MGRVWSVTGHPALAARARAVASRLEVALRRAVRESAVRLSRRLDLPADGSRRAVSTVRPDPGDA